ncbi:hypothetical protein [Hymenobacter sp. CRA2]|uniref:hypothetical protein n=1 Tax=Hymenobacter sp. CRA2 TaxID=1955620 RepID=UPI00098FF310|nr:hypothetical protein [Hymenobacter sp. CRA2]OON69620.1 hypothetical protein B0919_06700 [Hymenobacter sp. CRA2]
MKTVFTLLLPATASLLLSSCNTGLVPGLDQQEQELPQYQLSAPEQEWATPYRLGQEWRFRNEQGYERRYQVKGLSDQQLPGLVTGTKRVGYYQQGLGARLERVDSSYVMRADNVQYTARFSMTAAIPKAAQHEPAASAQLDWGGVHLALPAADDFAHLPTGVRLLPTARFGGRTYSNVLEYARMEPQAPGQWQLRRVYYTKENGVVRFEEVSGAVWTRQ